LKDVHKFYFKDSEEVSKESRNIFIKGNLNDVKDNFQVKISLNFVSIKYIGNLNINSL
jgi:hypothetical protein